jgi:tetratricopeptide (TPR) repeat protein/predicted Ser/Thr protein kinase
MSNGQRMAGTATDPADLTGRNDRARAYRLFVEALVLEGELREQFLTRECGPDPKLRAEVDALLMFANGDGAATGNLLTPPVGCSEDLTGESYGHFRLTQRIGEGGMGVVYRAERNDGVQQAVAIKLLSTTVGQSGQARFEREARLLAQIEHPAVARLVDAGVESGRAWIAMEFVNGLRIDDYCRAKELGARAIVGLLTQLAGAVAAAHRMLVVHNDIKPTNVLVTAEGVPKLIDFGISKALQEAGATGPGVSDTLGVGRLFSPGFAAPEQIDGTPVTVQTDVFGVGALAYRLLTGGPTFPDAVAPLDYMLAITQRDVELPSRAAEKAGRSLEARQLRGDLDAILCKTLERDPNRRYASATEMQSDFLRYLSGHPVIARVPTVYYRAGKFVRRNRLGVSLLGVVVFFGLCIIVGAFALLLQQRRTDEAREMAARRGYFLENLLKSADPHTGKRDVTVAELLDAATKTLDQNLGHEPLVEASMLGLISDTNSGLGRYTEALAGNERELALLKTHNGGALEIARALLQRSDLLIASERDAEAKPLLAEAMESLRGIRGAQLDYARALNESGMAAMDLADYQEADKRFRESIAIDRGGTEEMHRNMGEPMQNLAVLLFKQGRYVDAAVAARETIDTLRQYRSTDAPALLQAEAGYALTLARLRRPAEAEAVLRDVVAQGERVRGPEHPETLASKVQLGENLVDLQRYADAAALLRPTAESLDRVLGPNHTYATTAWGFYAVAACNGPNAADGLAAEQRIAEARKKTLPAGDWHISNTQAIIGLCLTQLRRYAEAEPILRDAVDNLESSRGTGFANTQRAYKYLRDLYLAMDRRADAEALAGKIQATPRP